MNLQEYQAAVNKTWKSNDGTIDVLHCRYALLEEVGEIAGWYKKHYGYGRAKSDGISTGLKEEFGDLLYYIAKFSELNDMNAFIEQYFEDTHEEPELVPYTDPLAMIAEMSRMTSYLIKHSRHHGKFAHGLIQLTDMLFYLIAEEGFDLEEIQFSNLAKLKVRHGDKFDDTQSLPANRDKNAENDVIK
jgi:NTP pyrophosphatase (non-canonical NTP hydrolase)